MKRTYEIMETPYKYTEGKKWYSEEEVRTMFKELENYVGNSRFKISNESFRLFYEKIKDILGD